MSYQWLSPYLYPYRSFTEETKDAHYIHNWAALNVSLKNQSSSIILFTLNFYPFLHCWLYLGYKMVTHIQVKVGIYSRSVSYKILNHFTKLWHPAISL